MSLGLYKPSDPVEFVRMKGPGGKGYAEMAIQKIDISNEDEIATLENVNITFYMLICDTYCIGYTFCILEYL